jgi:hypothetical protein
MNGRAVEKLIRAWKLESGMPHDTKIMYSVNSCGELTVYTSLPGYLIGRGSILFDKYKERFWDIGIGEISITETAYKTM